MATTKRLVTAVACSVFALLAACGSGSAENDAAGTLTEAKQSTAEAKPAVTEPAPVATDEAAAQQAAADEAAKAATEDDAAGAAKASGKDGDRANGIAQCASCPP